LSEVDTRSLTAGSDVASSNVFNAELLYTPGGNDRINSLQNEDELTGLGDDAVLNATIGNANDASGAVVTPTLTNIKTVNATFSNTDGTALDLQDANGTNEVNVTRVSDGGATVQNMSGEVTNLSVSNTSAFADINLTYRNSELAGEQDVTVALADALIDDMTIGSQALNTQQLESVTFNVESASIINGLNLVQDGDDETAQALTINAADTFVLGQDDDGDGNVLEHNNGLVDAAGNPSTADGLNRMTVTGQGNVTLGSVGSMAGFELAGADATGDIAVNVTNAAGDETAAFNTGAGNDTVLSTATLDGDITTNAGDDTVSVTGSLANTENNAGADEAASVSTGEGADTVTVTGDVEVNAALTAGAGDDTVVVGGDVDAAVVNNTDGDVDGGVDAGEGDDSLTFGIATANADAASTLAGDIAGGAGNDTMTITAEDAVTANAATLDVTGVESLNLVSRFATNDANVATVAPLAADNDNDTANYTVDLARFDDALTSVSIDNQDRATLQQDGFATNADGDDIAVDLDNVTGEAISITSVETGANATDTGAVEDELGAAFDADVNLTYSLADNTDATDVSTIELTGDENFDVSIDDDGADEIEELTLSVAGAGSHGINLNSDFEDVLTVVGAGTGELTITNIEADAVDTAAHTGNVFLGITEDSDHTITTGAGSDIVDMTADTVDGDDTLNLGEGTDRLITETTLGAFGTPNSADDEVFEGFTSIEEIELRNDAGLVMNEDALATGVTTVVVDASSTTESGIRLGTDFERNLVVNVEANANADIENDADVDLDVRVAAGDEAATTDLDFTDAGTGNVAVTTTLVNSTGDNVVDIAAGGDNLDLTVTDGSLDSLTLVEGTGAANGDTDNDGEFDAGEGDNDAINVTVADAWNTGGSLTIDASAIDDFDAASTVAGFVSTTTGGATINGSNETDAELTIRGTANDDVITGGDEADTLTGNAGNDTFNYTFDDAVHSTSQSADTITDLEAGDVIAVDAGTLAAFDASSFASVASQGEGDNSLNGSVGDAYYSTDASQLNIDVDGDGDIQDGSDIAINVASFTAAQLQFTVTANAGGATIVTGAGDDTLNGGAGADTLTGGAGADSLTLGAGDTEIDNVVVAAGDTVASTAQADNGAAGLDDGDILTFGNGVDTVEEFADGEDLIDSVIASASFAGAGTFDADAANYGLANDEFVAVRGTYDAATGAFTTDSAAGTDMFVAFDQDAGAGVNVDELILIGSGGDTINATDFVA